MYKNLLSWLTVLLVLPSCSGTSPAISVVCEENNIGNCIIKWETAPVLKGQVKVYTSTSPGLIPEDSPIAMANISSGKMTIVTNCVQRTVANADKIVVLENGSVAEMGTPEELKKKNGIFARMVNRQVTNMN